MSFIYALELEHHKYYIGKSDDVDKRVMDHLLGKGSEWTRRYRPLNLLEIYPNTDPYDEDKYVKKYMNKYGIDNVRGGSYVRLSITNEQKKYINNELKTANNQCYRCGGTNHYVRGCILKK